MDFVFDLLRVVNLFAVGIIAGGQVVGALGLIPTVRQEGDSFRLHKLFLDHKGEWHMPIAHVLTIATGIVLLFDDGAAAVLTAIGVLLVFLTMIVSVRGNMPINNAIRAAESPPSDYDSMRRRWDRLHYVRTGADLIALVLFATAAVVA